MMLKTYFADHFYFHFSFSVTHLTGVGMDTKATWGVTPPGGVHLSREGILQLFLLTFSTNNFDNSHLGLFLVDFSTFFRGSRCFYVPCKIFKSTKMGSKRFYDNMIDPIAFMGGLNQQNSNLNFQFQFPS